MLLGIFQNLGSMTWDSLRVGVRGWRLVTKTSVFLFFSPNRTSGMTETPRLFPQHDSDPYSPTLCDYMITTHIDIDMMSWSRKQSPKARRVYLHQLRKWHKYNTEGNMGIPKEEDEQ